MLSNTYPHPGHIYMYKQNVHKIVITLNDSSLRNHLKDFIQEKQFGNALQECGVILICGGQCLRISKIFLFVGT